MVRIVNHGNEGLIFPSEGLPEWHPGEELDVRDGLAVQLLDREDGTFALAEGETDPRGHTAAELDAEADEPEAQSAPGAPATSDPEPTQPASDVTPTASAWQPEGANTEEH